MSRCCPAGEEENSSDAADGAGEGEGKCWRRAVRICDHNGHEACKAKMKRRNGALSLLPHGQHVCWTGGPRRVWNKGYVGFLTSASLRLLSDSPAAV